MLKLENELNEAINWMDYAQDWFIEEHKALLATESNLAIALHVSISKFSREDVIVFHSLQSFLLQLRLFSNVLDNLGTFLSYERLLFTEFRKRKAPI